MRKAVAGYPENWDLLALWLSSEEFTSLLRDHCLQSDAKFCALAFSFFVGRGSCRHSRPRPYSRSEVIHRAGDESIFPAFERERPRIVNNFAASASLGYEFSSSSDKMNESRLSNLVMVLESATNTQTRTNRL